MGGAREELDRRWTWELAGTDSALAWRRLFQLQMLDANRRTTNATPAHPSHFHIRPSCSLLLSSREAGGGRRERHDIPTEVFGRAYLEVRAGYFAVILRTKPPGITHQTPKRKEEVENKSIFRPP
jgi:hypothetical protein